MKYHTINFFLVLFAFSSANCQSFTHEKVAAYKNLILGNRNPQYISPPLTNYIESFQGAKGRNNNRVSEIGSLLTEAHLNPIAFVYTGKDYWRKNTWLKNFIITFEPVITLRMYKSNPDKPETYSSPVRPANFNPGFNLYYFFLNNSKNNNIWYLNLEADHLSNGQQEDHFVVGDSINYVSGDFSTNYLRFNIVANHFLNRKRNLLLMNTFSFRNEGEIIGTPLRIIEDQKDQIAKYRLGYSAQLILNEINWGKRPERRSETGYIVTINDTCCSETILTFSKSQIKDKQGSKVNRLHNFKFRMDIEHQVGQINRFTYYEDDKKRTSFRVYMSYTQPHWNGCHFFGSFFYGRDYLNIRYSDVIRFMQIGFEVPIQKYQTPNSQLNDSVDLGHNEAHLITNDRKYELMTNNQVMIFGDQAYRINIDRINDTQFFNTNYYPVKIINGKVIPDSHAFQKLYTIIK